MSDCEHISEMSMHEIRFPMSGAIDLTSRWSSVPGEGLVTRCARDWVTTAPPPLDLEAIAATVRAALDEHLLVVPPPLKEPVTQMLATFPSEVAECFEVVVSQALPPGQVFLVNRTAVAEFIEKANAAPMTFSYREDDDGRDLT